jgi:hypothetical protein
MGIRESAPNRESLLLDLFRDLSCSGFVPVQARSVGPSCGSRIYIPRALHRGSGITVRAPVLPSHVLGRVPLVHSGATWPEPTLPTGNRRPVFRGNLRRRMESPSGSTAIVPPMVSSWMGWAETLAQVVQPLKCRAEPCYLYSARRVTVASRWPVERRLAGSPGRRGPLLSPNSSCFDIPSGAVSTSVPFDVDSN